MAASPKTVAHTWAMVGVLNAPTDACGMPLKARL